MVSHSRANLLIVLAMSTTSVAGGAWAADLLASPAAAPYVAASLNGAPIINWQGFYIGAVGGYGWADTSSNVTSPVTVPGAPTSPAGALFGPTLGYNWQMGTLIMGVEGDYAFGNLSGNGLYTGPGRDVAVNYQINNMGTLRARIGYATGNWLLFGTGGFAWANASRHDVQQGGSNAIEDVSADHTGWTLGVGAEYAINKNWSAKGEYRYSSFGAADYVFQNVNGGFTNSVGFNVQQALLGMNYRW